MKVLIVANACSWNSWPQKQAAIAAFWAPLVPLQIDLKQTDFTDIPTSTSPGVVTTFGPDGTYTDAPGMDVDIEQTWLEQNILPLAAGYDLVVLQIANQPPQAGLPLGVAIGKLQGISVCMTFVTGENDNYYLGATAGETMGVDLGNSAEVIIEHEISHELYELSGQTDNTHKFFYSNQFSKVLTDIVMPNESALLTMLRNQLLQAEQELGLLKANPPTADMNSTTQSAGQASTTFPPMIEKWITTISQWEGANPELHNPGNLKYTTLTASWGAARGPAASDGGYLCQFATENAGEVALGNFLTLGCQDELVAFHAPVARTLAGFTVTYAGNPPQGYIDGIIADMGVPGDTQISTFLA